MNLEKLQRALLDAARRDVPLDTVPYAFEKRVMASLRARPAAQPVAEWATGMWRAAFSALAFCALVSAFHVLSVDTTAGREPYGESPDLEAALLAPLESITD